MSAEKGEEKASVEETMKAGSKRNITKIMYSMRPLFYIQSLFGIPVFRVVDGVITPINWKIKILCTSLVLAVCFVFIWLNIVEIMRLPPNDSASSIKNSVFKITCMPGVIAVLQYATIAITSSFLVDKAVINLVTAFAELDTLVRVETIKDFYKKSYFNSVGLLLSLIITHSINSILSLIVDDKFYIAAVLFIPVDFFLKFQIVLFCRIILMLRFRLQMINDYIATFVEIRERKYVNIFTVRERKVATEEKFNFIGRASENNTKIRDLATIYDLMGKICSMINEIWNCKIFMALISTFIFIVITMWTALYYYQNWNENWGPLINIGIWCFSAIYTVAFMSITCERLLLVRNETKVIVNKVIMNYDLPKTMRVQAKAFMELIEAWPLRIYIYDMFSVDITLMLKFISVATTYLIVIIQISHFF